ncbi:hypothetical protein ACJ41O_005388 [Fusarium nematophilum]
MHPPLVGGRRLLEANTPLGRVKSVVGGDQRYCDAKKPACSRCQSRKIQCEYATDDDNRGTAPKSYVRLLQARIKLLETVLWLHSIDVDGSIAQLSAQNPEPLACLSAAAHASSSAFKELCTDIEGALYTDERSNFESGGEARFFGPASGRLDFDTLTSELSLLALEESPSSSKDGLQGHPQKPENSVVSGDITSHLIDLYFEWEQPWCQVVDETLFRQSMKDGGRYFSPLLLNCILAMGSRYTDLLAVRTDPDDVNTAGRSFLDRAEDLLQADLKSPLITTIQSLAIMAVLYVAIGSDASGWLHHGMAIRLVLDMGLNFDSSFLTGSSSLPPEEAGLRRQIYWALYCTDKLWASYTGRVCTMLDSQGMVALPMASPSEGQRQSAPSASPRRRIIISFHRSLSQHCQILEKIMLNLYAPKKPAHEAQRRNFFDYCLLELKGWMYSLPLDLKIDRTTSAGGGNSFPQAYILNMVYHTSVILLTKPFLPKTKPSKSPKSEDANDDLASRASSLSIEAAMEICALGDKYRKTFGSFRRSPITATHCSLSAALVAANAHRLGGRDVTKEDRRCVESCIQNLRELSDSWTPSRRFWRTLTGKHESAAVQSRENRDITEPPVRPVLGELGSTRESGNPQEDSRVPFHGDQEGSQNILLDLQGFDTGQLGPQEGYFTHDAFQYNIFWPDTETGFGDLDALM